MLTFCILILIAEKEKKELNAMDLKMYSALRSIFLSCFYVLLLAVIIGCSMDPGDSFMQNQVVVEQYGPPGNQVKKRNGKYLMTLEKVWGDYGGR